MHIRWEFITLGVDAIVDRLSKEEFDILDTQIHIYQERAKKDEDEFSGRFDLGRVNVDDIDAMFNILVSSMKNTRSLIFFTDVLRQGLLMPQNPVRQ
jgi:Mg2+/Co2+ transporter CorB